MHAIVCMTAMNCHQLAFHSPHSATAPTGSPTTARPSIGCSKEFEVTFRYASVRWCFAWILEKTHLLMCA